MVQCKLWLLKNHLANEHLFANDDLENVFKVLLWEYKKKEEDDEEDTKWHLMEPWMLPGRLIFPSNVNVAACESGSQNIGDAARRRRDATPQMLGSVETGLDDIKPSLQIKIHVMQMSDLQYVKA